MIFSRSTKTQNGTSVSKVPHIYVHIIYYKSVHNVYNIYCLRPGDSRSILLSLLLLLRRETAPRLLFHGTKLNELRKVNKKKKTTSHIIYSHRFVSGIHMDKPICT